MGFEDYSEPQMRVQESRARSRTTGSTPIREVPVYRGFNEAVAIERGPLVYSLRIDGKWKKLRGQDPYAGWEVYPKSPWIYALAIDREHPERSITFEERPVGDHPFSQDGAPVVAKVKGPRLPG